LIKSTRIRLIILIILRLLIRSFFKRRGYYRILKYIRDKTTLLKGVQSLTKFDKNILVKVNLDEWIQQQIFFLGVYEKKETLFWRNLIKPCYTVIDIGANIGYYSLMASVRVGLKGRIYAFEPVAKIYNRLVENIYLNKITNIFPYRLALFNEKTEIDIYLGKESNWGMSSIKLHSEYSGIKEKVRTETLDDFVRENKIKRIDLIKIDAEGSEPFIIEGMTSILKKYKPMILTEINDEKLHSVSYNKKKLYDLMYKYDYYPFEIIDKDKIKLAEEIKEGSLVVFRNKASKVYKDIKVLYA